MYPALLSSSAGSRGVSIADDDSQLLKVCPTEQPGEWSSPSLVSVSDFCGPRWWEEEENEVEEEVGGEQELSEGGRRLVGGGGGVGELFV